MKQSTESVASRVFLGLMVLLTAVLFFLSGQSMRYNLKEGDISPSDIYATWDVTDRIYTEELRAAAEARVGEQYAIDEAVAQNAKTELQNLVSDIRALRAQESISDGDRAAFEAKYDRSLSDESMAALLSCTDSELDRWFAVCDEILTEIFAVGVTDEIEGQAAAAAKVEELNLSSRLKNAANVILEDEIVVNKSVDEELTAKEKERARQSVNDVVYQKDQIIVRKGDILTENQIAMMSDLGMLLSGASINWKYVAGSVLLAVLLGSAFYLYCKKAKPEFLRNKSDMLLFAVVYSGVTVVCFVLLHMSEISPFVAPVCVGGMLSALLFDEKTAAVMHGMIAVSAGVFHGMDWSLAAAYLVAGFLIIGVFHRPKSQLRIALSGLISCGILALTFIVFGFLGSAGWQEMLSRLMFGILNGIFVSVITVGVLPILEAIFDVLTPTKLNDLANPDKRLLKRLLLEASGTYHHSLTVANLASEAAEKIGADAYLAKVGAYYHDIGKLKNPTYFKENQVYYNPHDDLAPIESAKVILNHPVYGLQLAKQNRLPKAVQSIIAEHHGTTTVAFFYHKAVTEEGKENVKLADYSYQGPVPSSKEAALIMLADSCEAAVRSMDEKTPEGMEKTVRSIIKARLDGGQLSDSDLTLRDIETITNSFLATLGGYFHSRIQYPEEEKNE